MKISRNNFLPYKMGMLLVLLVTWLQGFGQNEAQEALNAHFDAVGQEQWDQVDDVTIDGRWVDEDYRGYSIDLYYKRPEKIRISGNYNGKKFVESTDGQRAWIFAPWKDQYEVQEMTFEERLMLQNSFILGSPLKKLENKIRFNGLVDYQGTVYLTFVLEEPMGNETYRQTFYLDRKNHQLYLETYEWGKENQLRKIYEKYRDYGPLSIPTAIRFESQDIERELIFDEVFIGLGIKDNVFDRPKGL